MPNSTDSGTPEQSPISTIQRAIQVLQGLMQVFEIRVLGIPRGRSKPATAAGWFNSIPAACKAVQTYVMQKAAGIYITLNPVNPALLARTDNQIREYCAQTTADKDIVRRVWLFLDYDPERADGISSSQEELDAALVVANGCRDWLQDRFNWPVPIEAMSGNGIHHVYRIDLPNDEAAKLLVQRVLQAVAAVVHESQTGKTIQIKLDPVVFNAARIIKLWGTIARKGADTADRPHRKSDILNVPDPIEIVTVDQLQQVANLVPTTTPTAEAASHRLSATPTRADVAERARKYVAKPPAAIAGQSGHNAAFRIACILMKDFALPLEDALPIYREWNETCQPPWSEKEMLHKLEDAAKQPGPVGKLLQDNRPARADRRAANRQAAEVETTKQEVKPPVVEYVPFPVHCLPEPVRTFVIETADSMLCDTCFVVLPLIAALAAAVGNGRRIQLKNHWTEPCVFWMVVIAESGTMKSPGLDAAFQFLRKLQKKAFADYEQATEVYQRDMIKFDADVANYKKNSANRQAEPPEPPPKPICVRLICENSTVEALAALLEEQPRGVVTVCDELSGWLNGFDSYKAGKGSDVAHWLSMHRAGSMTHDRKTGKRITFIPHAAVSVAGGIQPNTLATALAGRSRPQPNNPETQVPQPREHFDNGLAARLLLAMPPRRPKVWTDQDVSIEICEKMESLFADLVSLEMGTDENGKPCPVDLPFTRKARAEWVKFYNEHALEQVQLKGDMAAAWSKLEGYAARFALLIHLIRYTANDPTLKQSDQVDEDSLAAAIEISRWFGDEASRIYSTIGARTETHEQRERRLLIRTIKSVAGGITPRELGRHSRRYRNKVLEAKAALDSLVSENLGFWQDRATTGKGGRPTLEFVLREPDQVPSGDQGVPSPSPPADESTPNPIENDDPDLDLNGLDLS